MKRNKLYRTGSLIAVLTAMILLSGCAWSIGGRKDGESSIHPSQGQELIDLKRARDQGAISDAEYEAQRDKVLAR